MGTRPDPPASGRPRTRTIQVRQLARVEGEGALYVKLRGDEVKEVRLRIFEPPRFFEGLLRGRDFTEAPDITARICGICPVAYQLGSVAAMEQICGVEIDPQVKRLRRLLYCGEWIESHALHVLMLHAPDFLGYPDVIRMAADHRPAVERGLALKKAGNAIVTLLGGREIHPVNVRVGGFYRTPARSELNALEASLRQALDHAWAVARWVGGFDMPQHTQNVEYVAMTHPEVYAIEEGTLASTRGLAIAVREYDDHFVESQVPHSTALHSTRVGDGHYVVGPMARYNLNASKLSPAACQAAAEVKLGPTCTNPFQSIAVRAVETLYACDEALRLIAEYEPPSRPHAEVTPRAGTGSGCTEAPRGICYHRYRIDAAGRIVDAKIVPPTSQNQPSIEDDLAAVVAANVRRSEAELTHLCEQTIRNYDPCISCSAHFLKLHIERVESEPALEGVDGW